MASIWEAGKATSTTRQPATAARREAILTILRSIAGGGRDIGGYSKPPLKLDLSGLINLIQTNPDALTKVVEQSGRPASPSTFQNLSSGLVTALLLGKALSGTGAGASGLEMLKNVLGLGAGAGTEPYTGTPLADLGNADMAYGGDTLDFLSGLSGGSGDGTYGVNLDDMASDDMSWLWS